MRAVCLLFFHFLYSETLPLCQVMSAISSSFNFTPLTYLAGLSCEFLLVHVTEFCVYFSSSSGHIPRSFAVLIQFLLIWLLLSIRFSLVFNLFEEFVDFVFLIFFLVCQWICWSCILS